jgi:hypothetical protein
MTPTNARRLRNAFFVVGALGIVLTLLATFGYAAAVEAYKEKLPALNRTFPTRPLSNVPEPTIMGMGGGPLLLGIFWPISVACLALGWYFHHQCIRRRYSDNQCQVCGYDLAGNVSGQCVGAMCRGNVSGQCPECGTGQDFAPDRPADYRAQKSRKV